MGVSAYSAYKRALQAAKPAEPAAAATPPDTLAKKRAYGDARPALVAEEAQPLASPASEPSDT